MKRSKLDILFSRFIKLRAGGYCQFDNKYFGIKSRGLHCAHWFSRAIGNIRYDPKNSACLCYYHHIYLDRHPTEKTEFFLKLYGQKAFEKLRKLADHPAKIDMEQIEIELRTKLKLLEG